MPATPQGNVSRPRAVLFAYSEAGAVALEVLLELDIEIAAIVTHRDDPHETRWFRTPREVAARRCPAVPVYEDHTLGSPHALALCRALAPDLILSVFYRRLLPDPTLRCARLAALNLHPSLLPRYRGRAPINWVLVHRETETGVTLHHMVAEADAGDIVAQRRIAIAPRETALSLSRKVAHASRLLLRETLPRVLDGTAPRLPQDPAHATRFGRRRPSDGWIDWNRQALEIDALVRAVAPPWPGAFARLSGADAPPATVRIEETDPDAAPPASLPPDAAPGTAGRQDDTLWVRARDRWLAVRRFTPLSPEQAPPPPTPRHGATTP